MAAGTFPEALEERSDVDRVASHGLDPENERCPNVPVAEGLDGGSDVGLGRDGPEVPIPRVGDGVEGDLTAHVEPVRLCDLGAPFAGKHDPGREPLGVLGADVPTSMFETDRGEELVDRWDGGREQARVSGESLDEYRPQVVPGLGLPAGCVELVADRGCFCTPVADCACSGDVYAALWPLGEREELVRVEPVEPAGRAGEHRFPLLVGGREVHVEASSVGEHEWDAELVDVGIEDRKIRVESDLVRDELGVGEPMGEHPMCQQEVDADGDVGSRRPDAAGKQRDLVDRIDIGVELRWDDVVEEPEFTTVRGDVGERERTGCEELPRGERDRFVLRREL